MSERDPNWSDPCADVVQAVNFSLAQIAFEAARAFDATTPLVRMQHLTDGRNKALMIAQKFTDAIAQESSDQTFKSVIEGKSDAQTVPSVSEIVARMKKAKVALA